MKNSLDPNMKSARSRKRVRKPAINQSIVSDLWFNVGYLTALDREHDSIEYLKGIIELNPGDAAAFLYLGRIYLQGSDLTRAEYYLACAAELDGSKPEIAFNYGTCLAINSHYQKSVPWLRAAVAAEPENPAYCFNFGMSLLMLDQAEEAMHYFSQTLKIDSGHLPSAYNLGIYFMRNDMPDRAGHYFKLCLEIDPEYAGAWQQMLRIHLIEKDLKAAAALISKGLELIPDNPELRVDKTAFENISRADQEIMAKISRALNDLPDMIPHALERVAEFRAILSGSGRVLGCPGIQ